MSILFIILFFKRIKSFLFGERVKGETLQTPKLHSSYPQTFVPENEWYQEMKFGVRYGYRGSFYQSR
jgi:hypothetical protein